MKCSFYWFWFYGLVSQIFQNTTANQILRYIKKPLISCCQRPKSYFGKWHYQQHIWFVSSPISELWHLSCEVTFWWKDSWLIRAQGYYFVHFSDKHMQYKEKDQTKPNPFLEITVKFKLWGSTSRGEAQRGISNRSLHVRGNTTKRMGWQ